MNKKQFPLIRLFLIQLIIAAFFGGMVGAERYLDREAKQRMREAEAEQQELEVRIERMSKSLVVQQQTIMKGKQLLKGLKRQKAEGYE